MVTKNWTDYISIDAFCIAIQKSNNDDGFKGIIEYHKNFYTSTISQEIFKDLNLNIEENFLVKSSSIGTFLHRK